MTRLRLIAPFAALVLMTAAGCSKPFSAATPPGFVDLEDRYEENEYRATTADGVVLGIRSFENDPKGDMDFWSRAVENRMRQIGGYALLETKEVVSRDGMAGKQMRFGHDEEKKPHLYVLSLFVTEKYVYLLEAGGEKAETEKLLPQIQWSVKNFAGK